MTDFHQSYVGQLRTLVGNRRLITPGIRAIVQDEKGRVLLVRRKDNNSWGMPAGSIELGESVFDCLRREVKEETGLSVVTATPIAIYSEPRFAFTTTYGAEHQMLAVVFRVEEWEGDLLSETSETVDAQFFGLDDLPPLPPLYQETLADLKAFDGTFILK